MGQGKSKGVDIDRNAERLDLRRHGLTSPSQLKKLGSCARAETLFLDNNELHALPLDMPPRLRVFHATHNRIHVPALSGDDAGEDGEGTSNDAAASDAGALAGIEGLVNLQVLNLAFNNIHHLAWLPDLPSLTELNVEANRLSFDGPGDFPSSIADRVDELRRLYLGLNRIEAFPPEICALHRLVDLDLSHNTLAGPLLEEIGNLRGLETLNLSGNFLTELPATLGALVNLTRLDLKANVLTNVPGELSRLTCLKALLLNDNAIVGDLPSMRGMSDLNVLDVYVNQLSSVPPGLANNRKFNYLSMARNNLKELGPDLRTCANLTQLDFSENHLTAISSLALTALAALDAAAAVEDDGAGPSSAVGGGSDDRGSDDGHGGGGIFLLPRVYDLRLNFNQLTTDVVDGSHLLAATVNIESLDISHNALVGVPCHVLTRPRLTRLDMSFNALSELPAAISSLVTLRTLAVASNELRDIPDGLLACTGLTTLNLSCNRLSCLPDGLGDALEGLVILSLSGNPWTSAPDVAGCTNLQRLSISRYSDAAWHPFLDGHGDDVVVFDTSNAAADGGGDDESADGDEEPFPIEDLALHPDANLRIKVVSVVSMGLVAFPTVTRMEGVRHLVLSNNALTALPDDIGLLEELVELNVAHNQLTDLPRSIANMGRLVDLDISANAFEEWPPILGQLYALRLLKAGGNDHLPPPSASPYERFLKSLQLCALEGNGTTSSAVEMGPNGAVVVDAAAAFPLGRVSTPEALAFCGWAEANGPRPTQEDTVVVMPDLAPGADLYCVFDGHGGGEAASMAAHAMPELLRRMVSDPETGGLEAENLVRDVKMTYRDVHTAISNAGIRSGCTAVVAVVTGSALIVANAGDARIVGITNEGASLRLSKDHKPNDASERQRIKALDGGYVMNRRTNGVIAVSRSMGDCELQPYVSWVPGASVLDPTALSSLVIACDGLWDVLTDDEVGDIVGRVRDQGGSPTAAACLLRDAAIDASSMDNVSVVCVWLDRRRL